MPPVPQLRSPRPWRAARRSAVALSAAILVAFVVVASVGVAPADARPRTRTRTTRQMRRVRAPYPGGAPAMEAVIRATWPAGLHREALNVAWCESRGRADARNGQYRGHFQIGRSEWARYGSGNPLNGLDNSAAAYRYFRTVGSWSPWQCQP